MMEGGRKEPEYYERCESILARAGVAIGIFRVKLGELALRRAIAAA